MTPMFGLLVAWGILTGILIILLIYRSTLTMHEDDSIFLNDTESQMHKDQMEVLVKMNRITPIVKILGALSGVMILIIAGLFVYQGLIIGSVEAGYFTPVQQELIHQFVDRRGGGGRGVEGGAGERGSGEKPGL